MDDYAKILLSSSLFRRLDSSAVQPILELCEEVTMDSNSPIFAESEIDPRLYVVQGGQIQIYRDITSDVSETIVRLGVGDVFGEMEWLDGSPRSASARTELPTQLLAISRSRFDEFMHSQPMVALRILDNVARIIAQRLRATNEVYFHSLRWNHEVSSAQALELQNLAAQNIDMEVTVALGLSHRGRLERVEHEAAGHQLLLRAPTGATVLIPYHAVRGIRLF